MRCLCYRSDHRVRPLRSSLESCLSEYSETTCIPSMSMDKNKDQALTLALLRYIRLLSNPRPITLRSMLPTPAARQVSSPLSLSNTTMARRRHSLLITPGKHSSAVLPSVSNFPCRLICYGQMRLQKDLSPPVPG